MAGNLDALADRISSYLAADQVNLVRRAYYYAEQAHDASAGAVAKPTSPTRWRWPTSWPKCTWTIRA